MTIIAECRSYQELIAAFRTWIAQLGTHGEAVDHVAGLPLRYTMKIVGPRMVKNIGRTSLGPLLGALGLKLVVAVDQETLDRIRHRLTLRRTSNGQPLKPDASIRMRALGKPKKRKFYYLSGNPELARILALRMNQAMTDRQRSMSARRAALARWGKLIPTNLF